MAHVPDNDIPLKLRRQYQEERTCTYSVDGVTCTKKHFAKGLCQAHYMRRLRNGSCGSVEVGEKRRRVLEPHHVIMARQKIMKGEWQVKDAADFFGVAYTTMVDAVNGRTFKDVRSAGFESS